MEVFKALPRDRVQQPFVEQTKSFLQVFTLVEEVLVEVFKASPKDRAQQRFLEQNTSTFPFLTVVLKREVVTVFPEDRVPQCLLLSRPSVLIVEVLSVFLVDRVPQRLPSSRLLLRLLIGRCHKPRFMVDMTSGCAWLMWRTITSTTGTGGTTLRPGGCRGESSTAGAGSPLVSTWMLFSDQKDSCAVVLVVMTHLRCFSSSWLSPYSALCLVRHWLHAVGYVAPSSSGKYSGAFVFTAPLRSQP